MGGVVGWGHFECGTGFTLLFLLLHEVGVHVCSQRAVAVDVAITDVVHHRRHRRRRHCRRHCLDAPRHCRNPNVCLSLPLCISSVPARPHPLHFFSPRDRRSVRRLPFLGADAFAFLFVDAACVGVPPYAGACGAIVNLSLSVRGFEAHLCAHP